MNSIMCIVTSINATSHAGNATTLNLLEFISDLIVAAANLFIAYKMYELSKKQKEFHENEIRAQNRPYLYPIENWFIKNKYKKYEKDAGTRDEWIKYNDAENNVKSLIDECLRENNRGKVYITYFESTLTLMTNRIDKSSMYLNHHNMIMTLKNYGATLQQIKINWFKTILLNDEEVLIHGKEDRYYPMPLATGEEVKIIIDEAISDINKSFCNIHEDAYEDLEDFDQFTIQAPILTDYKSMIINVSLFNIYGEEFIYDIKIENKDGYFQRTVEPITS